MRIFEVNSFLNRFNAFLLESFKEDMYNLYPKAKNDDEFNKAIKIFNSNENKIRDAVKKEIITSGIEIKGNIAKAIKNKCSDAASFISLIKTLSEKLEKEKTASTRKREELEQSESHRLKVKRDNEYRRIMSGKLDVPATDYWLIPCHTFEEAHEAASKYAGNLPKLSKEKITEKYGIDTPEAANFFKTKQSPKDFLEFMKNENKFFIVPTWCVAAGAGYFNNTYKLATKPDEKAKCYIIISKKYPNVRFCLTLKGKKAVLKDGIVNEIGVIGELRDPWQIGGSETERVGKEMMKLAFGEDEVEKILQKVLDLGSIKLSDVVDGKSMFHNNADIHKLEDPMPNLKTGDSMFGICSSLKSVKADMPNLVNGRLMFTGCRKLRDFIDVDLSSLKNGEMMFSGCESLNMFHIKELPSLEYSYGMFDRTGLTIFSTNMPKLKLGSNMFSNSPHLWAFEADTPLLENGNEMFNGCTLLSHFDGDLSSLKDGWCMFNGCKLSLSSINHILRTINRNGNGQTITIGYDKSISDENIEKLSQKFEKLNWRPDFRPSKS